VAPRELSIGNPSFLTVDGQTGSYQSSVDLIPVNAHGAVHFTGTQLILELWCYADLSIQIRPIPSKLVSSGAPAELLTSQTLIFWCGGQFDFSLV
jgi:hypothetical protein